MKEKLIEAIQKEQNWFASRGHRSIERDIVLVYLDKGLITADVKSFPLLEACVNDLEQVYLDYGIV